MNERFVDVVIDIPHAAVDQLYTYSVPSEWSEFHLLGSRIVVPFGNRRVEGVAWREAPQPEREGIKSIIEVLDERPILSREQMELCDWLADHYLSLRIDALHLFLPPGMQMAMDKHWLLQESLESVLEKVERLDLDSSLKERVCQRLALSIAEDEPIFRGKDAKADIVFSLLAAEGYLQTDWQPKSARIRPKTERVLVLASSYDCKLTTTQQKIVDFLETAPAEYTSTRLSAITGIGAGVIRRLIDQGVLTYRHSAVSRITRRDDQAFQSPPVLTDEQEVAYKRVLPEIMVGRHDTFLLHGVTGSGKTEVYLRLLDDVISQGKQGIFLVPEISLTPQTMDRVRQRLGDRAAILHSRLSDGERYDQWWRIFQGEVDVVVGARSALFAPLKRIGLIILDEEHEYSYKQEESPRYQTRDVAEEICRRSGAVLILGSATPSLESWQRSLDGTMTKLNMEKRVGARSLPSIETIDMRQELKSKHFGVISRSLSEAINESLSCHEQIILLLNRRGFSTFVMCRECGHVMNCPHCDVSLTFHQNPPLLKCHYCGFFDKTPDICPHCRSRYIRFFGQGTQRLEEEVRSLYPEARVGRMDLDSTSRKGAHERIYRDLVDHRTDILIGTQMVAKGLDIPNVTLVGVVAADASLNIPDFRSAERTFQLLTQVAGRAGRGDRPGKVVIQTYNPDHYCIQSVVSGDIDGFYGQELDTRKASGYPPFNQIIRVGFSGTDGAQVARTANNFTENMDIRPDLGIELLGPVPATIERIKGRTRWHLIIKGSDPDRMRELIRSSLSSIRKQSVHSDIRIIPDINPYSLF